jgi:hypothetical protein
MSWLDRVRTPRTPAAATPAGPTRPTEPQGEPAVERASPGLAALFARLARGPRRSILDLGEGNGRQIDVLAPYAHLIRFAGLVPRPGGETGWDPATIPAHPERPYDVVLAWDALDWLDPAERTSLMHRLDEVTAPGAGLYASVDTSGADRHAPVRTTLLGPDKIRLDPAGAPEAARPSLLPAQAERLLEPFRVQQAFSLRIGVREYVAWKD